MPNWRVPESHGSATVGVTAIGVRVHECLFRSKERSGNIFTRLGNGLEAWLLTQPNVQLRYVSEVLFGSLGAFLRIG